MFFYLLNNTFKAMKKIIIFLALVLTFVKLNSQNYYEISFSGDGAMPEIVKIENLTQLSIPIIEMNGADVLHLLFEPTGINNMETDRKNLLIYPNPMTHSCNIEFFNGVASNVNIRVFSIDGKQIHNYNNFLVKGWHRFHLSGVAAGIYVVNVLTVTDVFTGQFVSTNQTGSDPGLINVGVYSEMLKQAPGNNYPKKEMKSVVEMNYEIGDELKFVAYADGFEIAVIYDTPNSGQTYSFLFYELDFINPCPDMPAFVDSRDGRTYHTVLIGDQCWMAENLKYLPSVNYPYFFSSSPFYYVYGYYGTDENIAKQTISYKTYGVLYNWGAAMNGSSSSSTNPSEVQGICPVGWHLPSDAEWQELEIAIGMSPEDANNMGDRGTDEGSKLSGRYNLWLEGALRDNSQFGTTGFSAIPGGYLGPAGGLCCIDFGTIFWSATFETFDSVGVWFRSLHSDNSAVARYTTYPQFGFSVRCVKD